ncbi:MAG: hypothetical protein ONB27_00840 [candidate division KSB1 bacterium]|nr:hypothetical protein [candidate division KSB1 bacterium]
MTKNYAQQLLQYSSKTIVAGNQASELLIGGLIDKTDLKIGFLNNGRFCPPAEFLPDLPNGVFGGKEGALSLLDLWVGIPDGPWAPKVWHADSQKYLSLGSTVSGTIFEPFITGTDWSTIIGTENVLYTGDLHYSDIYPPSHLFDFILAPTSELEATWGRDPLTGFRKWPGRWRNDPATGQPMDGAFFGTQDIFLSFDDKTLSDGYYPARVNPGYPRFWPQRGYPIGAEVLAQIVGFQDGAISNLILFDLLIINTSNWDYHDVYIGLYYKTNLKYAIQSGFIKNQYHVESNHIIPYNLSYSYPTIITPERKCFAVQLVKTPAADHDHIDNNGDGQIDEPHEELGLTGWHFVHQNALDTLTAKESQAAFEAFSVRERLQYQFLAGDTTGLKRIINLNGFFADSTGHLDTHFDSPERINQFYFTYGFNPIYKVKLTYAQKLLSCGPINWSSGDTLHFVFGIMVGDNLEALKATARVARKIVTNGYNFDPAPPAPHLRAVAHDRKVTLYWDRSAETAPDFLTGYHDFEGYKIYRTTSDPATNQWGQPNYDDNGKFINFVPIARCDLDNGINGFETVYPYQYLGDDTGLFHTWTDTTVTNGVTYWYSVCSYDHGILTDDKFNPDHYPAAPLKECSKGIDPDKDVNLVKVIPGLSASDRSAASATVEKLAASAGNGLIEPIIIDPHLVTGHDYLLTFEDTTYGYAVYDLFDETAQKAMFDNVQQTNGGEGIIFDGIQLIVQRYDNMDVLNDRTYWYKLETGEPSPCTWTIVGSKLTWDPYPFEYDIRFIDRLEISHFMKKTAPFEIWNTVLNRKCLWDIFYNSPTDTTDSLKNSWSSGDLIYIWDEFIDQHKFTLRITISSRSYATYQGLVNIPPQPGDVAHIALKRPFLTGDQFRIKTTAMQQQPIRRSDLKAIKVVPNPYIVEAGWELSHNDSKIQFVHLPSRCKIHIYTLSGDQVRTLVHENPNTDYEFWDLLNHSHLKVSYGLYLFVVETDNGETATGKFVILR